ncbi:MAG TPA: prolyl oligopeptidase family serine peptidase [Lacunisphaera sp.]|jgi:dienelactone hydrolase
MVAPHKNLAVASLLFVLAAIPPLCAADEPNLERIVPVPAGEQIPLSDFFRPSLMKPPQLNPSGTHIAALVSGNDDRDRLLVYELKTQKTESFGGPNDVDMDVTEVNWLNDERLIFGISLLKRGGIGKYTANVGSLAHYYPMLQYAGASLIAVPPADRTRPLLWLFGLTTLTSGGGEAVNVDTNIRSGKIVNLLGASQQSLDRAEFEDENQKHIVTRYPILKSDQDAGYLADKAGHLAFGYTVNHDGVYQLHRLAGDHWESCPVNLEEIDVIGTGDQPGELVVTGPRNTGHARPLQLMDGTTGKLGEVLLKDDTYDFNGSLYRDPGSRTIVGAVYDHAGPQVAWFNPAYLKLQEILNGFFPGVVVRIIGNDEKGELVLVSTYSDRQPPVYQWVDVTTRKAGLIKNSMPWIDPARMRPMQIVKYKTRDGHRLDAYLTLPAGASKQNPPPMVVLPHDGPHIRNTWGFDAQAQFFASRGYAVLQPNYRSSPGYGWMFPREDDWAFDKMRDDVIDATKGLASSGLVDGRRIAIIGTGFGGYLAADSVASEPALYRCAVSISGIYDWAELIRDNRFNQEMSAPYNSSSFYSILYRLGDPKKEPEKFNALSVLQHAGQIRVPLLMAYGEFDSGILISQAKSVESTLKRNGIDCDLEKFTNESFGILRLKHVLELYTRVEAFLAKNLIPVKPVSATP